MRHEPLSRRMLAPVEKRTDDLRAFRRRLPQGDSIALMILWTLVLIGLLLLAALLVPALMGWNGPFVSITGV